MLRRELHLAPVAPRLAPSPMTEATRLEGRIALSIPAAVAASGLSRSFLYRAMSRGELMFIKKGRRRLIPTEALSDYLLRADASARAGAAS